MGERAIRTDQLGVDSGHSKGERTKCVSLARAYEDTRYTASVTSFKNGVKYVATPYTFYS